MSCPTPKPVSLPKAQTERSFHVFYELLAGLDSEDREKLSLQGPEAYYYLNQVELRLSGMVRPGFSGRCGDPRSCPTTSLLCSAGPSLQAPGQRGCSGLQRAGEGPAGAGFVCRGAD